MVLTLTILLFLSLLHVGTQLTESFDLSPPISALVEVLDQLQQWVVDIPPVQQSLRYGNPAYRTWFARMADNAEQLMKKVRGRPLLLAGVYKGVI